MIPPTELTKGSSNAKLEPEHQNDEDNDQDATPSCHLQNSLLMLQADMAVHAPLVRSRPALPFCCVILAHQTVAAKIFAAYVNRTSMDSNVRALDIVAHAATSFQTVIDDLIDARLLKLSDLNSVNSLRICGDNRHADRHVTGIDISIFDRRFHYIRVSRNDLLTGLVLHFFKFNLLI